VCMLHSIHGCFNISRSPEVQHAYFSVLLNLCKRILRYFTLFIPCIVTKLETYVTPTNALFCICSYYLSHSSYMFRRYITPSSGSWHQSCYKTFIKICDSTNKYRIVHFLVLRKFLTLSQCAV
jgi:hypothetical protein